MSEPMDKPEDVELPPRPKRYSIKVGVLQNQVPGRCNTWSETIEDADGDGIDAQEFALYADEIERQLKAALSANREKDAEIERLKGILAGQDDAMEENVRLRGQLASLRASSEEKWIEIKEGCEMPAQSGRILVYCPDSSLFLEMHGSPIGRIFFRAERGARGFIFKKVTHWMPYKEPAPPTLPAEKE